MADRKFEIVINVLAVLTAAAELAPELKENLKKLLEAAKGDISEDDWEVLRAEREALEAKLLG